MSFGDKETLFRIPIQLSGKPETAATIFFKNMRPLTRL
jgi:hypothetical protein